MKCAIYIRVSTDEQADKGNSLIEQREQLQAFCKGVGWVNPALYIDDGYSAKDLNRPAVKRLIDDVQKRKIDVVLTTKLDRLSRNQLDLLQTIKLFEEHDCGYASASERFDTSTAAGRLVMQILGSFAEFERERISERVKDNMTSIARNTDRVLTAPCYGYDITDGKYTINPEEAAFVEMMFEMAENGHGHRYIAKRLNDLGQVTKRGKEWDQVNVKRLMLNETICGTMIYNKRYTKNGKTVFRDKADWIIKENNHPAIISPERFYAAHKIIKSRSIAHKHADSETYLLTGLLKCKHCGRNMKGSTSRHKRANNEYTYYRYICASYVNGYGCKHHAVHRENLETVILKEIEQVATSSHSELKLSIATTPTALDEIHDIENQLNRINKKMQKQIEAYEDELISADDLRQARKRLDKEKVELTERKKYLEEQKSNPVTVKTKAALLLDDVNSVDRIKAKHSIRQLISQIMIEDGELVTIVWNP